MTGDQYWASLSVTAAQRCLSALDSDLDIRALQFLREAARIVAQAITEIEKQIEKRIAETPLEKPQ
jgi:hypothetical protein